MVHILFEIRISRSEGVWEDLNVASNRISDANLLIVFNSNRSILLSFRDWPMTTRRATDRQRIDVDGQPTRISGP